MNAKELIKYALQAKDEYSEQIDAFVARLEKRTENPDDYISIPNFAIVYTPNVYADCKVV